MDIDLSLAPGNHVMSILAEQVAVLSEVREILRVGEVGGSIEDIDIGANLCRNQVLTGGGNIFEVNFFVYRITFRAHKLCKYRYIDSNPL